MGKVGGSKALLQTGKAGSAASSSAALGGAKVARYANWKAAESSLKTLGGVSHKYFNVGGIRRFIDQFADGIIHESKYGYVTMSKAIRQQIAVDAALIKAGKLGGEVKGGTWHFFRSAHTGKIGASHSVLDELRKAGIKVITHD